MAYFTSKADLNVGLANAYILNSRGIVENNGQTVIDTFDPTGGLPTTPTQGDRYISLATANGWVIDNIEQYDEDTLSWKNVTPIDGALVWYETPASFMIWNATAWVPPTTAFGGVGSEIFLASAVWAIPAGVTNLRFTMWGSGGGGAGGANDTAGGGGGSGAMVTGYDFYYTAGGNITVTVGTGGAGGVGAANGSNGGDSVAAVGSLTLTAYGGGGGNLTGAGGGGGGAGGAGSTTAAGDSSSVFPLQGPFGAPPSTGNAGATSGTDGIEGDASYSKVISGSSGGGANSLGTGIGGDGANFNAYSGGTGGTSAGAAESNGGGGAAGGGGAGGAGSSSGGTSANGTDAPVINGGAGGGGGAAEFGFSANGGAGSDGLVIVEYS